MWNLKMILWCTVIWLFLFVVSSFSVYTPSVTLPRKPHLTPGIKTTGWKNSPNIDVQVHHNYSHVNYQNPHAGNALTAAQIYESTTKRVYPVYKPDSENTLPERKAFPEDVKHQKVIVRVKKQLQTYEKCPPGMTGQMVYSLSCNQFLNCWKGRTFIQNCSPGTLFNPDTLTCDFPEKVRCITGPRRTIYEEPPPSLSHTINTRNIQPNCPDDFSGRMPNYSNCSKFIVCTAGQPMNQICPPGTLFDTNRNVCDFPKIAKCFNGENQDSLRENVDYFVIGGSNQVTGQYKPSRALYQTQYGNNIDRTNCGGHTGCSQPSEVSQVLHRGTETVNKPQFESQNNRIDEAQSCPPFCYPITNKPEIPKYIPPPSNHGQYQYQNINSPQIGCDLYTMRCISPSDLRQTTYNSDINRLESSQINPSSGIRINLNNKVNQSPNCFPPNCPPNGKLDLPQNTRCNPSISNCPFTSSNTYPTNFNQNLNPSRCKPSSSGCGATINDNREGKIIGSSYSYTNPSTVQIRSNCNPQFSNCGGQPHQSIRNNLPTSYQPRPTGNYHYNQGYNPQNPSFSSSKPTSNRGDVQCPPGASGVHPHPYNCSMFLNCANGQTFIMPCGPGTLFNKQIMNCDFAYNVDCVTEPDGNDIRPYTTPRTIPTFRTTTETLTTIFTYLTTNKNYHRQGHYITRPPISQTFSKVSDYEDIGPSRPVSSPFPPIGRNQNDQKLDNDNKREVPTKNWPPPYPATDTNADYVFEYMDVDMESDLGAENSVKDTGDECTSGKFMCGGSKCISFDLVCNRFKDCPNGEDENGCIDYVNKFDVQKNTRLAVPEKQRWDNTTAASCAYLCLESKKFNCKAFNYRKIDNCCLLLDKNEAMSGRLMAYPPNDYYELKTSKLDCTNKFKCNNNKCIEKSQICDGQDDCGGREDEMNCSAEKIGYGIRLKGGKQPWEGRIEVTAFGKTGYVCDDKFDIKDANVVCKELGYHLGAADVKGNSVFAKDIPPEQVFYMMDDVTCFGNETSIRNCDFNGWGSHDCTNTEVVGVVCIGSQEECPDKFWKCKDTYECVPMAFVCDGPEDCTDGSEESEELCNAPVEVRLVNGSTRAEGRVEVKYHDVWGTVCDDDFNDDAAKVICKSLGYKGTVVVKKDAYFGEGQGPIWLDQVTCFGNESKLEKCSHWTWGEHNCDHSEDVGVICSNSDTSQIERHVKKPQMMNNSDVTTDTSYPIYPTSCGLRKNSIFSADTNVHFRVVQGSKAKVGDFPWQAAIRVKGQLRVAHWCGAVVISSKFVLTAAHCLVGYPKGAYVVVAGDYNVAVQEGTEQQAYIEDFYVHEDFRKGHPMDNDIAVVKLKGQGFRLGQDIQAICLPDEDTDYNIDLNCTISGFGSIESGVSAFSNELRAGDVPLLKESVCKMPHVYSDSLTDGMFCAGYLDGGTDACDGDSGGPLACLDNGFYTLYGITSWGHRCGYANKPGVYVKVAHYRKWIDNIIRKNV